MVQENKSLVCTMDFRGVFDVLSSYVACGHGIEEQKLSLYHVICILYDVNQGVGMVQENKLSVYTMPSSFLDSNCMVPGREFSGCTMFAVDKGCDYVGDKGCDFAVDKGCRFAFDI